MIFRTRVFLLGLFFILSSMLPMASAAATLNVCQDNSSCYATISEALLDAVPGDRISVGLGTWTEPVTTLAFDVEIIAQTSSGGTVLDGDGQNRIFHVTNGANVTITGFVLQHAYAEDGGAIHVDTGATAIVNDCQFLENRAHEVGAAGFVRHSGSLLVFNDCLFRGNHAPLNAGAVGVSIQSQCNFNNCRFEDNSSTFMSGAIANFDDSRMEIVGCVFLRNTGGEAGAIRIYGSPAIITNCTFFDNTSALGTIYCRTTSSVLITNNIIVGDRTGYGLHVTNEPLLGCNIFFDNARGPSQGTPLHFSDQIVDPMFCAAEGGNLSLCADSPATALNSDCGLIGALEVGCGTCGPVAIEATNWGTVKSMYR